jgi:hypothetical protein
MSITLQKPLPPTNVPQVDPPTGKSVTAWYEYFKTLDGAIRALLTAFGTGSKTVSTLPSAVTAGAGARAFVTDANSTTFHATVAGGGANKVPVVSDGTNWLIG